MTRFERLDPALHALPRAVERELQSPALLIYLDHVRENLRRVIAVCGGVDRWRPHVKTSKIPQVFAELARAGLRNFKCATTREADELARTLESEGVEDADVLLAYPLIGPGLARLGRVAEQHPSVRFSVLSESPEGVGEVPRGVSIFVDVNPGMHRTGVPLTEVDTILEVARRAGERFRGVHYYDGHLHDGTSAERRPEIFACYDRALELLATLREAGLEAGELITSGTPTFLHSIAHPGLRELGATRHRTSPGTVVYSDLRTEQVNEDLDLIPAALVHARVVSHPAPDLATCDAGSKSIAAEAGHPCAFVLGHPGWVPQVPNEEHLPLRITAGPRPARGTSVLLVPLHVCPTVNLAEEAVLIEGGEVLDLVPVTSRAHELRP